MCINCSKDEKTLIFIDKLRKINGDFYGYEKCVYVNSRTKVCLIHPDFGDFWQSPRSALEGRRHIKESNIKKAKYNKTNLTTEEFINKSKIIHNNYYEYNQSEINFRKIVDKVPIVCPKHGVFYQEVRSHMSGSACFRCGTEKQVSTRTFDTEKFIKLSQEKHGFIYDYSKSVYVNAKTDIEIICPIHGSFFQEPFRHYSEGYKCPCCPMDKSKIEKEIIKYFYKNNINFKSQKTYKECINIHMLRFDFYLMDFDFLIEYDGEQHFLPHSFNKIKNISVDVCNNNLESIIKKDNIKNTYCINNKITLLRIHYKDQNNIEEILNNFINLLKSKDFEKGLYFSESYKLNNIIY